MGCEPESSELPRRHQPITSPHTRVMSYLPCCFLLIYFVLIFVPTLSIFICYFHRLMNGIVPGCVRVEGRGQRSASAAAAAVLRLPVCS